jgi:hypothetical protein
MAKKFEAPGNLQDLEAADLEAAVKAAFDRAEELRPKEGSVLSDEDVAEATAIRDFVRAAKEENAGREAAAAEREQLFNDIDAELGEAVPAEGDEAPAEGAPAEGEPAPAEGAPTEGEPAPAEAEEAAAAPAGELVSASRKAPANFNRGSFAAKAAKAAPASQAPVAKRESSILMSATNTDGFQMGQQFANLEEAGDLIAKKLQRLPKDAPQGTLIQNTALQIALPENQFSMTSDQFQNLDRDAFKLLQAAGDETRLTGKSLVAAGGWGAPSERSLDFCKLESIEGLIKLPEVAITRGGIQYTKGPKFADVLGSGTGFWDMTEAVAEAGVVQKTFLRPSIPTFTEQRLDAVGVGMEAGLLLRQGWPEVIARYSELLLTAHQYKMAQKTLNQILAFTGAAKAAGPGFGNAIDLLHRIELIAAGERQRTFMSPNQTLEAVIPHWVKNVIRVDVANRNGVQDVKSITDAQIDAEFTARKIKVQWITAWQNITIDATGIALQYPQTVEILLYPAGTYVRGVAPVITLDTIYDSTNLKKNDYVELFVEQGTLVTNPCGDGLRISMPLLANGRRAQDNIVANFGV